jgi:hypothetical protein
MRSTVLFALVTACKMFDLNESPPDATPDAGADGPSSVDADGCGCAWGCISGHCARLVPAGGGVTPDDLAPDPSLQDFLLATATFDSSAGTISGITSGFDFVVRGAIGVFRFKSLHIAGHIALQGTRPIALVADGEIVIGDVVEAGTCVYGDPGPGGLAGAAGKLAATGSGGGGGGGNDTSAGGGGGGHGDGGGSGGGGPAGGVAFGDATITALRGGGGGGGGGGNGNAGGGGGGGGAVQIASNTQITITNGGGINAGGCGGHALDGSASHGAGGGGGAGGTILLEAPVISVWGALAVNGGSGAGGGDTFSGDGARGSLDRTAAPGGVASGTGGAAGGDGGAAAMQHGAAGAAGVYSGGGGGAAGWIRVNTRTGTATVDNTHLSPALDDVPTTCTEGVATVE